MKKGTTMTSALKKKEPALDPADICDTVELIHFLQQLKFDMPVYTLDLTPTDFTVTVDSRGNAYRIENKHGRSLVFHLTLDPDKEVQ